MGSTTFTEIVYTSGDMEQAYRNAVDEALTMHGRDPYSGTIATSEGVKLSPLHTPGKPVPVSQVDWEAVNERFSDLRKWSPCEALPIRRVLPAKLEHVPGRVKVETSVLSETVRAANDGYSPNRRPLEDELLAGATREVNKLIRAGGPLVSEGFDKTHETAIQGTPKDYRKVVHNFTLSQPPRATTRATKGATETRYFVLPMRDQDPFRRGRSLPAWDDGFPTQAKARAALPQTLDRAPSAHFEIVSMTRRAGGEGLVTHDLDALAGKRVKVEVSMNVARILEPEKVLDERGWLLYGWAAC